MKNVYKFYIQRGVLLIVLITIGSCVAQKKDSIVYNKEYFAIYRFDELSNKYIETPQSTRLKISTIGNSDFYNIEKDKEKSYYSISHSGIHLHGKYSLIDVEKPAYDITSDYHSKIIKGIWNSEGYFSKGYKIEKWEVYHKNSPWFSKIEEHYNKGVRDGLYTVYDKNNIVLYQTTFEKGTGVEKIYRSDGSLYQVKHFKKGLIDVTKPCLIYHSNGQLAVKEDYSNNIIIEYSKEGLVDSKREIKSYSILKKGN